MSEPTRTYSHSHHPDGRPLPLAGRAIAAAVRAIARLPLPTLYALTAPLALAARSLLHYRVKVVRQNLTSSFPNATPAQTDRIVRGFYRWFGRWGAETLKLAGMSATEARRRLHLEGFYAPLSDLAAGRHVSLFLGHYANWEWLSSLPLHLPPEAIPTQIYHPLENATADAFFLRARGRFGAISIPMETAARDLITYSRRGPTITGYIADQAPGARGVLHWTDFLNHDTAFYTGAERISAHLHAAAYYVEVEPSGRGQYTARFIPLCSDASTLPPGTLTESYARALERTICRRPDLWLWSHRRWKRGRAPGESSPRDI